MMVSSRLQALRKKMSENKLDGLFITDESNVRYLSGYTNHDAFLLITAAGGNILITDFRYDEQARSECPQYEVCVFVKTKNSMQQILADKCAIHGVKRLGFEPNSMTVARYNTISATLPNVELVDGGGLAEQLRYFKDIDEQELLAAACAATDRVFTKLCGYIREGMTEKQVEWQLLTFINEEGCESSFSPIVVSGANGSLPHGVAGEKVIENGDFLTMDFGCMYQGYHADMTRTVFIGKCPSEKQLEIYNIVLEANRRGVNAVRAGVSGKLPDDAARNYIAAQGYGPNFGHGLGHGVGLDIHENPFMSTTCEDVLAKDSFVTVEPGIYIPGWGGVRIEDTVRVTEEGCVSQFSSSKELICL